MLAALISVNIVKIHNRIEPPHECENWSCSACSPVGTLSGNMASQDPVATS